MNIGNAVVTKDNEHGIIVKEVEGTVYDWWVELRFVKQGKKYTIRFPYRTSELKEICSGQNN